MPNLEFVKMEKQHLPWLLDIELLCFSHGWSSHTLDLLLHDSNSFFFVIIAYDNIAGYGGFRTVLDEANLDNIAIHPNYQGLGLGEKLLLFLIDNARGRNVIKLSLEVRESNIKAISLYKKLGFKEVGQRPNYYTKPSEAALLMDLGVSNEN